VKLRAQLSLFFGGLLALVLTIVIVANYQRLYRSLKEGLESQFSLQPYAQLAEVERELLVERANALVDRPPVLNGVRRVNSILSNSEEGLAALEKIRTDEEHSDFVLLNSTYEQMLQVLSRTSDADGQDLVLLAGAEGTVIAETFNQRLRDNDQQNGLTVSVTTVADQSFWETLSQFDSSRGYLVYPNGELYLYGFASFQSRFAYEGVAVVGKQVDQRFLRQLSEEKAEESAFTDGTHLAVVYGGKVVGTDPVAVTLGEELVQRPAESGTWADGEGHEFLIKSKPLLSYYLSDEDRQLLEEAGLLGELKPPGEVGRVYLLRGVDGVRQQAFAGARETLLLGAFALVLALLAVPLIARRFTTPIAELSDAMTSVGQGKLEPVSEERFTSIAEVKTAAHSFNEMVVGLRQKKILEHFVPEGTRREVEELRGQTTELGGKRWERTIMFSDLRGFTSMSERMSPDEVMAVLNKYLHVMSRAIRLNGGDINEYIGDAILAVFENPDDSMKAALAMHQELKLLRKDTSIAELADLSQGIGLHTGPLVEGNIGEENRRLKRAVVGDTVNLAARIQDRSRDGSHTYIFLSQDTKDRLKGEFDLVFFGEEEFKGKKEPIPVWEIRSAP